MNRVEIKEAAKAKIKGHKWDLIWPMLLIGVVVSVLSSFFAPKVELDLNNLENMLKFDYSPLQTIGTTVVSLLSGILSACYMKYVLEFARTGKTDANIIIKTFKEKWLNLLIATLVSGILIAIGFALFIVPGIILALAYAFADFLIMDSKISGIDALKKSRTMMKGYKGNYFVFLLSFIGWYLLVAPTLGLIMIWLFPYMSVAMVMYYDKLKQKAGK